MVLVPDSSVTQVFLVKFAQLKHGILSVGYPQRLTSEITFSTSEVVSPVSVEVVIPEPYQNVTVESVTVDFVIKPGNVRTHPNILTP